MKETDDGTKVDVSDVGSIPTTSTKTLVGGHVHGVKPPGWYYTASEWSRLGMQGPVPPNRIKGGDLASTGRIEIAQEDSNTKYKRQ